MVIRCCHRARGCRCRSRASGTQGIHAHSGRRVRACATFREDDEKILIVIGTLRKDRCPGQHLKPMCQFRYRSRAELSESQTWLPRFCFTRFDGLSEKRESKRRSDSRVERSAGRARFRLRRDSARAIPVARARAFSAMPIFITAFPGDLN